MSNTFTTPGNNITQRITFNSGAIDFGSNRVVQLDSCNLSIEWGLNTLYVLNSIVPQDINRHSQKITLGGKLKSFAPEVYMLALASSTVGTPQEIDPLDGQPTFQNPVITLIDRNGKEYQYQVSGAIFKSIKLNAKMEDYAEFDFDMEAKGIAIVYTQ